MTYYPPQYFTSHLEACRKIAVALPDAGQLVWECVVPAEWCPPGNKRDKMHWKAAQRMKQNVKDVMARQLDPLLRDCYKAMPGKPIVHVARYTPHRVDPRSNWDKFPVDALTPFKVLHTKDGPKRFGWLGLIADDSADHIDLRAHWVKSKLGVVHVRVFSGRPESGQ